MSGEFTQAGGNRAVQAGVGQAQAGTLMYVALATALPGTPDLAVLSYYGDVELTTAGYARATVTWGTASGNPSTVGNADVLTFGTFTADPPNITHAFLCDVASGTVGNALAYWVLAAERNAAIGDTLSFLAGSLTIGVD